MEHARLQKRISLRDFEQAQDGDEQAWLLTQAAKDLIEEERAWELRHKSCKKQAERLSIRPCDRFKAWRRSWMQMFTTSKMGLDISTTGIGALDNSLQSRFREELLEKMNATNPDPIANQVWCSVISEWVASEHITAAHIFSHAHGQHLMDTIFEREDPEVGELFSPFNGILMYDVAEEKFDKGFFVIVPHVADDASPAETALWHASEPKRYKIRVVDKTGNKMNTRISSNSARVWNDLDGEEVTFKTGFRPRARYLYLHYCKMMLRRSWIKDKPIDVLRDELGKPFWGTPGPYLRRGYILAFIEEMGHEYEELLEGAMNEKEGEKEESVDPLALVAANDEILLTCAKGREGFSDDSGDDESGEEQ